MATNYPSSIQTFGDPISTDTLSGHAALHTDINDTVEAIQNKLGVDGDTDVTTVDRRVALLELEITPTGSLTMFAGSSAPSGWLLCNGAEVPRTGIYADLFAVVGTTYGVGNGSTTFNVPDLRNRAPVGSGSSYTLGQEFGLTTDSFTIASGNLPRHTHTLGNHSHSMENHTHGMDHTHQINPPDTDTNDVSEQTVRRLDYYINNSGPGTSYRIPDLNYDTVTNGMQVSPTDFEHVHATDIDEFTSGGASSTSTGGNSDSTSQNNDNTGDGGFANTSISVDIIQPSLGINFIIKV